jgi:two-component system phosphate regulon response regulator PhoB
MATVMIVDDEPHIITLVRVTLEDERLRIVEANDGEEAIALAERELPDLILLDIRMPRLDGFEVCRRLRQEPRFHRTKIVMLTASGQERDRSRGLAAGADDYLTKPFSPLALLSLVQTLLPSEPEWPES